MNNYKAFKNIATLKNGYTFKNNLYSKSGKYNIVTISNVTGNKYIDTNFKNKYEILPTDLQPHQLLKNNDILSFKSNPEFEKYFFDSDSTEKVKNEFLNRIKEMEEKLVFEKIEKYLRIKE